MKSGNTFTTGEMIETEERGKEMDESQWTRKNMTDLYPVNFYQSNQIAHIMSTESWQFNDYV